MLPEMIKFKQINPANADIVKRNYLEFCSSRHTVSKCTTYRLDKFIFDLLDNGNFHFPNNIFTDFVKKILLLFHGNADVKRGFSINKDCLANNMTEASLIAQRSTYSALHKVNLETFKVNKSLFNYCKNTSARRKEHLHVQKMQEVDKGNERKVNKGNVLELENKRKAIKQLHAEELDTIGKDLQILKKKIHLA